MWAYFSSEELFKWCKIPPQELPRHSEAKVKLRIVSTPQALNEEFANTLLEEVKANNAAGAPLVEAARFGCLTAARAVTVRESIPSFGPQEEIIAFAAAKGFEIPLAVHRAR
jgi:predicted transcriptional regulator